MANFAFAPATAAYPGAVLSAAKYRLMEERSVFSLVAFATQWGSQYGGINSFNQDFIAEFGARFASTVNVICIVATATPQEIQNARDRGKVRLVPLDAEVAVHGFDASHGLAAVQKLAQLDISYDPSRTIWLGHDRITGAAAIAAAQSTGGRSALLYHMSYAHYEAFAESSATAHQKEQIQKKLFAEASLVLAIGPLLRDALCDLIEVSDVPMLVPGLAQIEPRAAPPKTFNAFLAGRLGNDASRIKQGYLGLAAFGRAHRDARSANRPPLSLQPRVVLRGVVFEHTGEPTSVDSSERELLRFLQGHADAVINLHALPYTHDRDELYKELRAATVAMMPSWHEGFGLVAWEAIAAGVPVILSRSSGVFKLIDEQCPAGEGCLYPVDVRAAVDAPYFHPSDLDAVAAALHKVAEDPIKARRRAAHLRDLLSKHTWTACVQDAAQVFGWPTASAPVLVSPSKAQPVPQRQAEPASSLLRMPTSSWRSGLAESQLLRAEERIVPFDAARNDALAGLRAWLDDSTPVALRLLTGQGGVGKTRLALQLCSERREHWTVGLLDSRIQLQQIPSAWQRLPLAESPTLVVVDYAETRQAELLALLGAALRHADPKAKVRILLLARDGGEWWERLASIDANCEPFLNSVTTTTGPFELQPLHSTLNERVEAFRLAQSAFAKALSVAAPDVMPELSGEHFAHPLYLQMTALLSLHGERPMTLDGMTKSFLNHEIRYWRAALGPFSWLDGEERALRMLTLATLSDGFATTREVEPYWRIAFGNDTRGGELKALFGAMCSLYPTGGGLQPLQPDLVGEALVARTLRQSEDAGAVLDAVLGGKAEPQIRRRALTVLARLCGQRLDLHERVVIALKRNFRHCAADAIRVAIETGGTLPGLMEEAFDSLSASEKQQTVPLITQSLPTRSVSLAGLVHAVYRQRFEAETRHRSKKGEESRSLQNLATLAKALSYAASEAGLVDDALIAAKRAVEASLVLLSKDSRRSIGLYAECLSNYAGMLTDAGRYNDTLEPGRQALEIQRELAERQPDEYDDDFAWSLGNYSNSLREVGKHEEALALAQQAVEIRQRRRHQQPSDEVDNSLAATLGICAVALREMGRYDEALAAVEQAVEIRRSLAQRHPDRFDPDFATSLGGCAIHLRDAGRHNDALTFAQQSLEIRRRLAQLRPDRFDPDFVESLVGYATHVRDTGRYDEALSASQQAVEILRRLAQIRPERFEPHFAAALGNHSAHLGSMGRYDEALIVAQQSLEIFRRLAQIRPDRFDPETASSLGNYAAHLQSVGRHDDALASAEEGLEILRRLAKLRPERFDPELAALLINHSALLEDAGKNHDALISSQKALKILARLAKRWPDRYEPEFALALNNVAASLSFMRRYDEALASVRQGLEILQKFARSWPDRFDPDLATLSSNYANLLQEQGRYDEAIATSQHALEIWRRLTELQKSRFGPRLASALLSHAGHLGNVGRHGESLASIRAAGTIYEQLASKFPHRFGAWSSRTRILTAFIEWLGGSGPVAAAAGSLPGSDSGTLDERRDSMAVASFVEGCLSSSELERGQKFELALSVWNKMTPSARRMSEDFYFSASAWQATYCQHDPTQTPWVEHFHARVEHAGGRLPKWMLDISVRLKFSWPKADGGTARSIWERLGFWKR